MPDQEIQNLITLFKLIDSVIDNADDVIPPRKAARDSAATQPENNNMASIADRVAALPATGKTVAELGPTHVSAADVIHRGEQIIVPDGMLLETAIRTLFERMEYMQQTVSVNQSYDAFPYDGAAALERALVKRFGWASQIPTPRGWSEIPPTTIAVEVAFGETRQIPWGRFSLPGIPGWVQTTVEESEGNRIKFQLTASTKREHEKTVRALFDDVAVELKLRSIYNGKAVKVRFFNDAGERLDMPTIKFIDTQINERDLIYSRHIEQQIVTNLFTPIVRRADCEANGIPFKRGVLLGGTYGTGKTMAAKVASKLAVEHGITFIYNERADELAETLGFARTYQNPAAVIFSEDIDRVMSGERDVKIDEILNIIDGIDSKNGRIMVVLTTNELEDIEPAMLRPGRLDAVINVTAPDAEACERLLRSYGGASIEADEDLSAAGKALEGQVPAVLAEAVKRSKLAQLARQAPGVAVTKISGEALAESARSMRDQIDLLQPKAQTERVISLSDLQVVIRDEETEEETE